MHLLTSRPFRVTPLTIALTAILSAAVLFSMASIAAPAKALGASTKVTLCDGVSLRTKPSSTASRKAVVPAGSKVFAVAAVSGSSWRVNCGGKTVSGNSWYRITVVEAKTASSRYGVTYVYAASGLFKTITVSKYTACDRVGLFARPSLGSTRKAVLALGTNVSIYLSTSGGSWRVTCGGKAYSGNTWYRITSVKGQRVSSRYGVSSVYAPVAVFRNTPITTSAPTPNPDATPTPTPTPKPPALTEGIDVSHWQGTIDWTKVRASGKRFAYLKASEHTSYVDNTYEKNRAGARAAGLYVGAYHFARPDATSGDAVREADHFVATGKFAKGDLLPVLDLEDTGGLGSTALQAWVRSFVDRVHTKTGVRSVIYVSPSFWSTKMGNSNWFAKNGYQVLWIAHWTTSSQPSVPAENWGGKSWTFWQYTSSGTVPGISGRVDLDRYNGSDFTRVRIP